MAAHAATALEHTGLLSSLRGRERANFNSSLGGAGNGNLNATGRSRAGDALGGDSPNSTLGRGLARRASGQPDAAAPVGGFASAYSNPAFVPGGAQGQRSAAPSEQGIAAPGTPRFADTGSALNDTSRTAASVNTNNNATARRRLGLADSTDHALNASMGSTLGKSGGGAGAGGGGGLPALPPSRWG